MIRGGQKISMSFPEPMNGEIEAEARARRVKVCRLMRLVWVLARKRIRAIPSPHRKAA